MSAEQQFFQPGGTKKAASPRKPPPLAMALANGEGFKPAPIIGGKEKLYRPRRPGLSTF